ncbi:MAG: OmpA family protein, partial [Rubrivivax sp.]|nr:OmpA family protein [Rubrivivax sp.]
MKKLNKVAMLFASAALAMPMAAFAQAKSNDNWRAADGTAWKNGNNELCWRNAGWTPATADAACDGALKPPAPAPAPAPAPRVAPPPPPPPPAAPPPPP